MMSRSQKIKTISRKWKDIARLGQLVPDTMRSQDDGYWKAEDSSLEHQVTITILSTVISNETENAHFLVSQKSGGHALDGTAASILSDLASQEQLLSQRSSRSRRRLVSTRRKSAPPTNLPVHEGETKKPRSSLDFAMTSNSIMPQPTLEEKKEDDRVRNKIQARTIQFVDSFDPLELDEEPVPEFALVESFDSLSWGPGGYKGTTTVVSSDSESTSPYDAKRKVRTKTEIDRNGFPKLD